MSEKAWFKEWFNSPYYHKLYFERDEQEAKQFIRNLLNQLRPETPSRMLDVACGKGRHSRILAEYGHQVTGIDISPESIDYARRYEHDQLEFFQHDMRLPFRINYYHVAFNLFTSFGYFNTLREHYDAIRTISGSLLPGSVFVLDYLNLHYTEEHLIHNEEKNIDGTLYEIHRWHDETHFYKKIKIRDAGLEFPEEYTEKVAKFSLGDFNDMLSYHGLQVQDVFGDYQLDSYDVKSKPRMILVARKTTR